MIESESGFILREIKYGDTSSIVKIYTKEKGLRTFMVKGLRASRSKIRKAGLFPLLEVEFSYMEQREDQSIANIKQYRPISACKTLYSDVSKICILTFLAEIMSKCFAEGQADKAVYEYISRFLKQLDVADSSYGYYHLLFLLEMSHYLGCYPNIGDYNYTDNIGCSASLDLKEGVFAYSASNENSGSDYLRKILSEPDKAELYMKEMNATERNSVLNLLVQYYRIQLSLPEIKSYQVLREVFRS